MTQVRVVDIVFDDLTKRWRISIWRDGRRRVYWRRFMARVLLAAARDNTHAWQGLVQR